jgi:hypothetical protein
MKNLVKGTCFSLLFSMLMGCASYEFSSKTEKEVTKMEVINFETPITLSEVIDKNSPENSRGLVTTDVLVQGANLAIQGIKMVIDRSQEKYNQHYISGIRNARFYAQNSNAGMMDPDQIAFKGFEISRTFINPSDEREVAIFARFILDENKLEDIYFNSKFYLVLDSFSMQYCKVKINKSRWYLPWSWFLKEDRTIQLDFEIDIKANWLDAQGGINSDISFGHFVLPLRNVPMDPEADNRESYFSSLRGKEIQGSSYILPRSVAYCTNELGDLSLCYGRGDFNIDVRVVESSKSDFVSRKLTENSDNLFEGIKSEDLIKAIQRNGN